jgi:hypothetical protein
MHENTEKWMELCTLAAKEQYHEKLLELIREINRLLAEKEQRLKGKQSYLFPATPGPFKHQIPSKLQSTCTTTEIWRFSLVDNGNGQA